MLKIGEWLFDAPTRRVFRGQAETRLSPKAAGVLTALAETPGQVWSRDALLERVWPAVTVGEEVLTHAIAELRRALRDDFREPRYVETVHKSGYRLLLVDADKDEAVLAGDDLEFDLTAYGTYLEACELYERGGRHNTSLAVMLFRSAVDAFPRFALAHAGLAKALTFLGTYYGAQEADDLETALEHSRVAQRLVPALGDAYAVEGLIFSIGGKAREGVQGFNTALRLKPDSGEAHYLLGRACLADLNFGTAARALETAARLRPDDYHSLVMAGKARLRGENGNAQAHADYRMALPRIEAKLDAHPADYRALCAKARCLWQFGQTDEAAALMDQIAAHPDPMNYHLACTLARAGETKRALDVLEQVVAMGWRHKAWLERDPDFDAMRNDRRFKRIERTLDLAA